MELSRKVDLVAAVGILPSSMSKVPDALDMREYALRLRRKSRVL
jgi:hypothetical protein